MHFKAGKFEFPASSGTLFGPRPRPSQLCPWLMPPIPVPGHASYPSGHATQATLLSGLLTLVMPAAVTTPLAPSGQSLLDRLAERVARNREVLGLHYPSDSVAGRRLAAQILTFLTACPDVNAVVNAAKLEWA